MQQQSPEEKMMMWVTESCPFKFVISGGMGFLAGGLFGLFTASMQAERFTPEGSTMTIKETIRSTAKHTYSYSKNFMVIGAIYSGTECVVESYRAKHDLYNSMIAGCLTGGGLAYKTGPKGMALGCAGFSAFSTAIDYWMEHRD